MKYTRYDLKKRNNNRLFFIVAICGILVLAFVSGTMISNLVIKNGDEGKAVSKNKPNNIAKSVSNEKNSREIDSFAIIQCGVFTDCNNANNLKNKLSSFGNPFIIKENNKNKVFFGIYSNKDSEESIKKLKKNKIEFSKVIFSPDLTNECNLQIVQIMDGELQVINKFSSDKVKSVQTKQLKKWCLELKNVNKEEKNYKLLCNLKENIKKLPCDILKSNIEDYNTNLYKNLKTFK